MGRVGADVMLDGKIWEMVGETNKNIKIDLHTLIINTNETNKTHDIISSKRSINFFQFRKIGSIFGHILLASSMICEFLLCLGYYNEQKQTPFTYQPNGKVLLGKYGDEIIYGTVNNGKITTVLVEHNISKIDTLQIIKLK